MATPLSRDARDCFVALRSLSLSDDLAEFDRLIAEGEKHLEAVLDSRCDDGQLILSINAALERARAKREEKEKLSSSRL
jgi:hypothetical protein